MRGIREAAMNPEPQRPKKSTGFGRNGSFFESDDLDANDRPIPFSTPNKIPIAGIVEIRIIIDALELGAIADATDPKFDPTAASTTAEEMAYDRITKCVGSEWNSQCTYTAMVYDDDEQYEVIITLTPNT